MRLDYELIPWSAKARELLRSQYAAVGAAARAAVPDVVDALALTAERGCDLNGLLERYRAKGECSAKFVDAYHQYCWPVSSVSDLKLAPFHILASEGAVHTDKAHTWHMETLGRLCAAEDELLLATGVATKIAALPTPTVRRYRETPAPVLVATAPVIQPQANKPTVPAIALPYAATAFAMSVQARSSNVRRTALKSSAAQKPTGVPLKNCSVVPENVAAVLAAHDASGIRGSGFAGSDARSANSGIKGIRNFVCKQLETLRGSDL